MSRTVLNSEMKMRRLNEKRENVYFVCISARTMSRVEFQQCIPRLQVKINSSNYSALSVLGISQNVFSGLVNWIYSDRFLILTHSTDYLTVLRYKNKN